MKRPQLANIALVLALVIPTIALIERQDTPMLLMSGIIATILIGFTILIRAMLRRGAPSAPELYGRTLTFWWMLAGFLVAVATPKIFSFFLMSGLCWLSWREHLLLLPQWRASPTVMLSRATVWATYSAVVAAGVSAYYGAVGGFLAIIPGIAFGLLPLIFVLEDRTQDTMAALGFLGLGLMYFVFGLGHGLLVLNLGAMVLVYCFFLTELRDLASYWIGKGLAAADRKNPDNSLLRLLNAKIAPQVSPNKAWGAGVISIFLITILGAAMVPLLPPFPLGCVTPWYGAIIGFIVGWLGLLGDLVFSLLKRDLGVKDSGHGLPGGTGVIDRIDSLVFTLPAVFHLIYWKFY